MLWPHTKTPVVSNTHRKIKIVNLNSKTEILPPSFPSWLGHAETGKNPIWIVNWNVKYLHCEAPVLALPPLLSATADKGVRAQSPHYHSVSQTIPPHFSKDSTRQMLRISKYCYEGTSLNNLIYTKLVPFTSRKKRTLRPFFAPIFENYFMASQHISLCLEPENGPYQLKNLKSQVCESTPFPFW